MCGCPRSGARGSLIADCATLRHAPAMTEEPENLTFVYPRRIDAKLDRIIAELGSQGRRITNLEVKVGHGFSDTTAALAEVSLRLDRHDDRLAHIERRLDILPAEPEAT